jgi:hypothetical protein
VALTLFTDTFLSLEDANLYNAGDPAWAAATIPEKEEALRNATFALNDHRWLSTAVLSTQPLSWPRATFSFYDPGLNLWVECLASSVPLRLKQAVSNLAKHYVRYPEAVRGYDSSYDRIKLGPLEVEDSDIASKVPSVPYFGVESLLEPLLATSSAARYIWWRAN